MHQALLHVTEDCDAACCATSIACSDMAMCGTAFYSRLQVLKRLQALWRASKPVVVGDAESDVEPETGDIVTLEPYRGSPDSCNTDEAAVTATAISGRIT